MHDFNDNHGHMGLPNPMDPNSGWTERSSAPDYSRVEVPDTAPDGMVFVPGLNTYVAEDVAASLGLGPSNAAPQGHPAAMQALDSRGIPAGADPSTHAPEDQLNEISDEELEALKDQLEIQDVEPSLSETADDIAACFTPEDFKDGVTTLVATGDPQDAVARIVEATGLDAATAASVAQTAIDEVEPFASEAIGSERWASLMYAASRTDDPFARRVVADFVTGKLKPHKLGDAYDMWWHSLPDAD